MILRPIVTLVLLVLAPFAAARAQAPGGTAQLAGSAKLAVRGCGADRQPHFTSTATLSADGTWAAADTEGDLFGGTWVAVGSDGRTFDFFFEPDAEADLVATIVADIVLLCDAPSGGVVVTSTARKRFTLTLNRAHTKAKLVLRYVVKGRANNRSGSAAYRIRAKGPFTPAS